MKKILNKTTILIIFIVIFVGVIAWINLAPNTTPATSETLSVKKVSNQILADGTVDSASTATLHFQVGGKLTYLPVKEGDTVYAGQNIAQLDTYALQKQVQLAANSYQATKNSNDQAKENQKAGVLEGQQRYSLDTTNKQGYSDIPETKVVYDNVQRIVDNANLAQNSAQLNIDLANYAIQLSSLTSPISGVVTHLDVTNTQTNITPATSFVVADPNNLVFNANVSESMINYISVGSNVKIKITNGGGQTTGTVTKIYPQRFTLPNGENGYKVEITAAALTKIAKMGQSGSVLIDSNLSGESIVVPTWTVLGEKHIWVMDNNTPILRTVTIGKVMGNETEILKGLKSTDKIILNPKSIAVRKYKIL
jgi:membrane fusion protein, macrolide-specific efflux system